MRDLLPIFDQDIAFWAAVCYLDEETWTEAPHLEERHKLARLARTHFFAALWRGRKEVRDLLPVPQLSSEFPRLRPWRAILEMTVDLSRRSSHADLVRMRSG